MPAGDSERPIKRVLQRIYTLAGDGGLQFGRYEERNSPRVCASFVKTGFLHVLVCFVVLLLDLLTTRKICDLELGRDTWNFLIQNCVTDFKSGLRNERMYVRAY